ncbi:MAG: hypothetical protein IJT14_03415 [Rickettsiales bacterium]|nr:hypothetical protein [Rickettsiales bacterium]
MQEGSKKVNNYRVPKGTTHLMMWIGSGLPTEREVHYQNEDGKPLKYEITNKRNGKRAVVNYVATLKGECEKMNKKGDSCILVYDSRMIRQKDKQELKKIVEGIPNCYLVDYKDYVEELKKGEDFEFKGLSPDTNTQHNCKQSEFIKDIDDNITFNLETNGFSALTRFSMGNLVDCMRILLLLHPGKLKKIANEKNKSKKARLKEEDYTLLYHDFDMIQPDQEVYKNNQQDNDDEIKKEQALFGKNMGNGCGPGNENGLIWVNSKGDRNKVLENIISNYLDATESNEYSRIIYRYSKLANANNFKGQFSDESHQSWSHASETDIKKRINICEDDYSRITEMRLKGLLLTCYKKQIATIPIQLDDETEKEMKITEFLENVNKQQNNRYEDYIEIAKKIEKGVKSKDNNKGYFDNIKLKEDEIRKINYIDTFMCQEKVERLEKRISEQINKHLGKSKDNPKKLHWDKDPNKGCKNGKLLNVRRFGFHRDYINEINNYYDCLLEKKFPYLKGINYNEIDCDSKYQLLEDLEKHVTLLEEGKANNVFFPCVSANEYRKVKNAAEYKGNTGQYKDNGACQGMY